MKKFFIVLILLIGILAGYFFYKLKEYDRFKTQTIELEQPVIIDIYKGSNWKLVAKKLHDNGIISNKKYFYYMIKEQKLDKALKRGEYEFSGKLSPENIIDKLISGKVKLYALTVPEGHNMYDVDLLIRKQTWIKDNDMFLTYCTDKKFLKSIGMGNIPTCEGMLFPSTYKFQKNVSVKKIIRSMDKQMQQVLAKYHKRIKKFGVDPYDILKLASVIEKETGVKEEQPLIASVFSNRLRIGMKLQSDPTVIYGFLPNFDGNIRKKHLVTDHPYSTYARKGLPKTPICFPGEGAIKSVLYPDKTSYLYFVSTNKGYHYFSKTLKEHNAAVEHYQIKKWKTPFKWQGK